MHNITLVPGDGTGPEIIEAAARCIEASGVKISWDIQHAGVDIMEKEGTPLPQKVIESIARNKVALKGPITTPVGTGFRSVNVALRHALDLYACVRPCKTYQGVNSMYSGIDLVIVRENKEDLYAGIEYKFDEPAAAELIAFIEKHSRKKLSSRTGISIKPISVENSERIVEYSFQYAIQNKRKKVTAVHKANIMKHTDGLFLEIARSVAKRYPQIEFEDRIVDNMAMQLVQKPQNYDVLVLPNLYGDILSDLCAGLIGGLGVAPGANIGAGCAVFEATHGSAPKYKGLNKVNPCAVILSGVLMLRHIGEHQAAARLENAVAAVISEGRDVTYDLKPASSGFIPCGTREIADAIIKKL